MCLAVPGRIQSITGEGLERAGRVAFGGVVRVVNLACVPDAGIGNYVLVHAGIAIARLDEDAAQRTLTALSQYEMEADASAATDPTGRS
jgi:hydrogenase expression/formation protein HypC